ncbi:alpha/beta hydrolase [Sphaerisporangium rhizosphaerae]|uniref:Alpha/beta hydrolase n=1 Tax=Sphaerisporangium rhizosphaerae TaxID=2269375 RepID=A0ABW2P2I5_9ACTN
MATGVTELQGVLSRVARLAEENASALDSCARCMSASAWVGGGAPAFAKALSGQRLTLQRAFEAAAHGVVDRIRQAGGQASYPSFTTSASALSAAGHGDFAGMNVDAMTRMVADLQQAGQNLPLAGRRLAAELAPLCLPAQAAHQVTGAGAWAEEQSRDLRSRLAMLQKEQESGMATRAMAAFGLFGAHAPDPAGTDELLAAAATGDPAALRALLALQHTAEDPSLAARVNVWWRQLGTVAQNRLLTASPDLVGNLNGLPTTVRDQANRTTLTTQEKTITAELARLTALGTAGDKIELLRLKLDQIKAVKQSLQLGAQNGRAAAFLISLELGGLGKTAISFGNPDEADNIVTYVPGTGSTLAGIPGDAKRAAVLWDRANSTAQEGKQVASMVWLGYEAPQWGATLDPQHSVALPIAALRGAPELASFTDGLRASHQPDSDVRSTMLGHSYGSLLTGVAARLRPGLFADQLIFIGSPGVEALRAKDLHVKQVWVGEAPNDPVGDIGHVNPSLAGIVAGLGPFGSDPSSPQFGAKKFYVEETSDPAYTFKGHSSYWDFQSMSLQNMGYLVNGQYDDLLSPPSTVTTVTPPPPTGPPTPAPEPTATSRTTTPSPRPLTAPLRPGD